VPINLPPQIRAKECGFISEVKPLVVTIQAAGVYYDERLVAQALHLAGES